MKKLISFLLIFILFPTVLAFESTTQCLNSSYLETKYEWTECDATCTDKNVTQVTQCVHGCSEESDVCKFVRKSEMGDTISFVAVIFSTGMFFFLAMKVQPSKEFSMLKNGLQVLFFFVGFWMLILTAGMAETIAVSAGVSENTWNLVQQNIRVLNWVVYITMFFLFLSYLISALWLLLPSKRR